ncbi:DUF1499 domain-containing protein [Salinispirillum marinum]|uniref:DUF1499 domain-containing protein n=2 Tax=Saccharospirillaceae TaxID=255527 RepID=A0ABV8B8U6_9GAMM
MNSWLTLLLIVGVVYTVLRVIIIPLVPPKMIGLTASGHLQPCPNTPNCVSSQASPSSSAYVAPLVFNPTLGHPMDQLRTILAEMGRNDIMTDSQQYMHSVFVSPLMGYRDDVEFLLLNDGNSVQVRSASRIGREDFQANRKRIEALRQRIQNRSI